MLLRRASFFALACTSPAPAQPAPDSAWDRLSVPGNWDTLEPHAQPVPPATGYRVRCAPRPTA